MTDYLAAERGIVTQLQAALDARVRVLTTADLAGVTEAKQFTPAVHVIYAGDSVPTGDGARGNTGRPQKITQRWQAVVAVRNTAQPRSGAGARDSAGPLLSAVITALAGHVPAAGAGALHRANAVGPAYTPGFAYYPTEWTTEFYT